MIHSYYRFDHNDLWLHIHLQPGAKQNAVSGLHGDALKIRIAAPPIDDRANEALIDFIAQACKVPKRFVTIERGHHSRDKWIKVENPQHTASLINL